MFNVNQNMFKGNGTSQGENAAVLFGGGPNSKTPPANFKPNTNNPFGAKPGVIPPFSKNPIQSIKPSVGVKKEEQEVKKETSFLDNAKKEAENIQKADSKKEVKADSKAEMKEKVVVKAPSFVKKVEGAKVEKAEAPEKIEVKEDVKEEPKKATRKTTRKAATKKVEKKADENVDAEKNEEKINELFKMPTTTIPYAQAMNEVSHRFIEEKWIAYREDIVQESDKITIEADMDEAAIKSTVAKLNALRERVWLEFSNIKTRLESISSKENEGLIERTKFLNAEGANDLLRKKSAVIAVMNFITPEGNKVNLYELYDETKERMEFLKSVLETITYKSNLLITMSSAVKIQKR